MLKDWLTLICLKPISLSRKRALIDLFITPSAIFKAGEKALQQTGIISEADIACILDHNRQVGTSVVEDHLETLELSQCSYIGFNDPRFPALLNEIPSPPLGLFVKGNIELLNNMQIAVVGSRNASPAGGKTAYSFATKLASTGLTITSGLATGIDSHAHRGCLSKSGDTIAVIGTGIDRVYPKSNQNLYNEIAEKGLIVTEFLPGTQPLPGNFPRRNRIISGLSLGTLVVEAGIRSGSLITARLAAEQGREVFAIPGSIYMATSRGCHLLIKQGAKLVESIADILEELRHFDNVPSCPHDTDSSSKKTEDKNPLYNLIDYAPTSIEQIIEQSGLTAEQVSSILVNMELQGLIVETNGSYQRLPV